MTGQHKRLNRGQRRGAAFVDWALPLTVSGVAVGATFSFELVPRTGLEWLTSPFTWLALLLIIISLALSGWSGKRSSKARRQQSASLTRFSHSLADTISVLRSLTEDGSSYLAKRRFFESMVREGKSLMPIEAPRICVYELDSMEVDSGPSQFLKLTAFGGRSDRPRNEFTAENEHGRVAIEAARSASHKCVDSVDGAGKDIQRHPDAVWESFMIVPLRSNQQPWGMLTIDTTKRTRFTTEHIAVAQLLARFIELGLADVEEAANDTAPEVAEVQNLLRS